MNLRINGEEREVAGNPSLQDLVTHLDLTPERIAIELNHNVVRRAAWPSTRLKENDQIEIVHFVGGGERKQTAGGRKQEAEGSAQK